jgi:hypothetical protein
MTPTPEPFIFENTHIFFGIRQSQPTYRSYIFARIVVLDRLHFTCNMVSVL